MKNNKIAGQFTGTSWAMVVAALATSALLACRGDSPTPAASGTPIPTATASTVVLPSATDSANGASAAAANAAPQVWDGDALYDAIWRGKVDAVEALIAVGADVNGLDEDNDPLLREAIWRGHTEIVRLLAAAGADVNARDSDNDPLLFRLRPIQYLSETN